MGHERCPGCGALLPAHEGETHRYVESSPACWAAYAEVLAREYADPAYMAVHRLTVDAYAAQHPGRPSPQAIRSVGAHLIALHAVIERGLPHRAALHLIRRSVETLRFEWLEPPAERGRVRVTDVLAARTPDEHGERVRRWARSVWDAWSPHHARVATWAREAERG